MDKILPTLDGYTQRLMGAHRKPIARAGVPCLVLHLGVWKPLDLRAKAEAANGARVPEEREARRNLIDEYLRVIYLRLKNPSRDDAISALSTSSLTKPDESDEAYLVLFQNILRAKDGELITDERIANKIRVSSEFQTITFEFRWHGLAVTTRFELHTEYFTISSYIDLSERIPDKQFKEYFANEHRFTEERRPLSKITEALKYFDERLVEVAAAQKDGSYVSESFRERFHDIHQYLYHDVWEQFIQTVLRTPELERGQYGKIFADFRAVVVGRGKGSLISRTLLSRQRGSELAHKKAL